MPIIQPRNVAMIDGKFEVSVFRGAADDRSEFGVKTGALIDQGNIWEHEKDGTIVAVGDYFRRRVSGWNGTDWTTRGAWMHVPKAAFVGLEPIRFNPNVEASAAAGQPMVDPVGLPIFQDLDGDGKQPTQPVQPASGEPARDPWTGELTGETQP